MGSQSPAVDVRLEPAPIEPTRRGTKLQPTPGYSAGFIHRFTRLFWPFARLWFRPRVEGLEHIPPGPCVFVGNHSGYGVMEVFVLLCVWMRRFGGDRPVVGLSHDVGLRWPLRWGVLRIGGVRASPQVARDFLTRGFDVLVFPGGVEEALRPFAARYEVRWQGRNGFLRVAADAGVPIVLFANCGSHAQFTLLPGGSAVARFLGLGRFRISTWPLPLGSLLLLAALAGWTAGRLGTPWVLAAAFAAFFPNPTRMQVRFLKPIDAREVLDEHRDDLASAAESLRASLEATLRSLAKERRTPWT